MLLLFVSTNNKCVLYHYNSRNKKWPGNNKCIDRKRNDGQQLSKLLLVHEPVKWTPEDAEQVNVVTWNMLSLCYFIPFYLCFAQHALIWVTDTLLDNTEKQRRQQSLSCWNFKSKVLWCSAHPVCIKHEKYHFVYFGSTLILSLKKSGALRRNKSTLFEGYKIFLGLGDELRHPERSVELLLLRH